MGNGPERTPPGRMVNHDSVLDPKSFGTPGILLCDFYWVATAREGADVARERMKISAGGAIPIEPGHADRVQRQSRFQSHSSTSRGDHKRLGDTGTRSVLRF